MYAAQKYLNINAAIIKMVCEKINNCKSGISKNDNCKYTFLNMYKKIIYQKIMKNHQKQEQNELSYYLEKKKKIKQQQHLKNWQQKEYVCGKCKTF